MADFDTKFLEMQKYLPFLKSVIEKLRNSSDQDNDNPRKAQLKKMEVLHDLLKSNGKKLKMETLLKCEGLLIKLASKMERIPLLQNEIETSKPTKPTSNISVTTTNTEVPRSKLDKVSSVEVVDITGPESPPPQQLEDLPPVEIPTERRSSRDDEKSPKSEQRDRHKHGSKNDRLHKHRHHFHHQRHEHHQSSHHSHEHHRQQSNQSNRLRDSSLDRSNDSSRIFNRRSVGTDKSSYSGNLNVTTTNHVKNHLEPQRNRDPRSSNEFAHDVYSSEDCWNDFSSNKSVSANRNHAKRALPDSSSVSKSQEQRYHDTVFSFKKNVPKSNEMFSRVRNPEQSLTLSNRSAPISIPVKVPTIPEVLKSPPLSASDISDLLSEADEKPNENSVPSISEIGTRRPVKSLDNAISSAGIISPSAAATLDKVRKKFAIVTQSSPHLRDSPDVLKSPITITPKDTQNPLPKERIALKYNPHPRTERNSHQNISDAHLTQRTDPRLNPHRFSSASNKPVATSPSSSTLPQDPRLRKAATTIVGTSLYQQPQIMQHKAAPSQTHINSKVVPPLITPAIAKTQSHIPSLMEVETIDPRIALSASFPSGSMDHRQQLTNNMPINIPQAGIFTRRDFPTNTVPLAYGGLPVPIEFGTRGNQHLDRPMVQQRSKSGYSSEENWDSDPDTAVVQKVIPQAPQIPQNRPFKEYPKGTDLHSGFRQAKAPLLPTPVFGRPNTGNTIQPLIVNPHLHQLSTAVPPPNSNHSKFSAVLNDKTERSKYFESKKQKKIEPRTYMEYKQAKARAAAEEAARKAAEGTAKAAAAATDKDIGEVSEVDSSVIAKLSEHPPTVSTLDKLYRSTNFSSCDFPKAKTSFKIPKKVTEKTADKSETETKSVEKKEEAKENKSQPDLSNQQQKDQPEQKIESLDKKKVIANNIGLQKDQEEQVKEKKEGKTEKKKNIKENTAKTTVGVNKKSSEKVKRKPAVEPKDTGECTAQDNAHATVSSVNSNPQIESKNAQDVSTLSDTGTTELVIKNPQSNSASCEVPASTSDAKKIISSTQEAAEAKTSAEIVTEIQESNESEPQRLSNSAKADSTPTKETAFLDELVNAGKPARILKRRNTMVVRGSLPEVDKEKIFPFKCLVYEDIQGANEEERRKQIDLMLPKKNKCLAEIFQKTDDNCKVSTQNIISGKRRTRTNVNFNVVQRSLEVFNHKRRSEPLKNSSEKASPIIKKPLPKGKKGAKRKAKQQLDEQATEEIIDTKKLDEGTAKLQKPSISKQTAAGMEYAKETPAEKIEKSTNPTRVDALMDEDTQKRHLLESFVQDILNPKKDKAQIFSLLSQILSEDNLKFVKEIVESQAEKNAAQIEANDEAVEDENISMSCEDLNKSNDSKEMKESESNGGRPMKAKAKMKKRNELDRLNEDIRTMFISQGVLTATGRRMCTLVAAAEQVSTCDDNTAEKPDQTEVDAEVKHKAQILPRIRKSKVVLEQLNVEELQKQIKIKLKVNKVKVHDSSEESERELNSDAKTEKIPLRKMPILKPHTPIKQSEVEDDSADELTGEPATKKIKLNVEVKKVKPGPKSKKPKSALLSDDEEDAAEECEQTAEKATGATNKSTIVKNTNKEWHSQSKWAKWCVLCDTRISYPAAHYKRNHPEHYTSRLSPEVLEKLKMGKLSKPYFGIIQKKSLYWSYRCVFCFQHNRTIQSSWMDHFITHTGEYAFECSNCRRPFTKAHQLDNHIKTQCIGGTVVRKNPAPHGSVLSAHVCHLCNFIQLYRPNLDSHFINQHDIPKSKIAKLGHTINLFDIREVKVVDALKALEIESQILNEGLDRDEVVDAENQEEAIEIDEQSNSLREANVSPNPTESVNIAKSLQCKESSHVKKAAVEEALNSNVFVPTRETNESPTMNNFAQSLFTITNEQREVAIGGAVSTGSGSSISIAERLSQRFKNIKSGRNATANTTATATSTEKTHTEASNAIDIIGLTSEAQNKISETAALAPKGAENSTLSNKLNSSTEPAFTANGESVTVEFDQPPRDEATSAATETAVDSPIEDDDDNWEDIEITESAPTTASSVVSTASGTLNKSSKSRNKNVLHKLNRLYATNNKLKKSLSITMANRKKTTDEKRDIETAQPASNENVANIVIIGVDKTNAVAVSPAPAAVSALVPIPAPTTDSAPALASAVQPQNEAVTLPNLPEVNAEPNLGFRPLITNLDDLLPDSPCNDPIELVPELTPMESLQDLYDVSSILNSDYMSDNWEPDTTPIHLNNDSQQANMQEALDFVKEQQREQSNVAGTPIANTTGPLLALPSIQRILNIGFSKSTEDTTFKFYCLSENCTFLYSSEAIGLESHFSCEHAQSSWNGYCHSCKAQVEGDNGKENKLALSAELNHMRSKHLTNPITPNLPVVETSKRPSKSNSPVLDEERPRIKIRRLTGDCLSTTPTPTSANSSKPISAFDENAQLVELTNVEQRSLPTISTSFLNKIQPTVEKPVENRHFQNIGAQMVRSINNTQSKTAHAQTPPGQLQITSVVSLNESSVPSPSTTASQLPVISNVCSLNARSVASPINNISSLWAQHIADERSELEHAAAESMEVSRILSTPRTTSRLAVSDVDADKTVIASDSPEPQVVAETLPVAQATTGNYLITQSVSAQYEEGRLGFNISIANNPSTRLSRSDSCSSASNSSAVVSTVPQFKCMANGCKYQTRLAVAMGDHLQFHDRQNFSAQREYLRCSQCSYLAEDVDGFMQHAEEKHGMLARNASDTEAIRDILRNPDSQEFVQTFTQETWETALREIVSATGVPDSKLFRCTIKDCKTKLTDSSYYSHVVYHLSTLGQNNISAHSYRCPHCPITFQKPQKIKAHIKTHGIHRYFCYMCTATAVNMEQMLKHFEERHWRSKKLRSTPLPYKPTEKQCSFHAYFVAFTTLLRKHEIQQFREKLIDEWQRKKSNSRTHFKPSEIGLLPLTPIFDKILNCSVCPYKTKVRTNLMRHLQMHTDDSNGGTQHVANVDPVNPVPCLNSSEKHFDKMTNLASSSLVVGSTSGNTTNTATGGSNAAAVNVKGKCIYEYVPDTKRYTCGVDNCQYLTISDDIFRSHLNALHSDILYYNCPHCKEEICKRALSIERILSHLRFHGPKLYQCEFCGYLHYMRNVVDRHIRQHDVHPPSYVRVVEHDRTKESAVKKPDNTTTSAAPVALSVAKSDTLKSKGGKYKWSCNLCGHKTMTQQQIVAHTTSQHSCKHQYQCMHCTFTATQLVQVMSHIDEKHAGKKREARYVFEKCEEADDSNSVNTIDTRPLWQRDDPTRVRHIRGILMEDEEESERYRKRLCLDDNDDGTENGDSDENLNLDQFGILCYYCNAQFPTLKDLREKHFQASKCKRFNAMKPFRFRICTEVKCPCCLSFVGNSLKLIDHMKEIHKVIKYIAADPNATSAGLTCGHCEYRGKSLGQLSQHISRMRHKPLDLKVMSLVQLEKLKALGSPLTYVQCLSCMELLANQSAFDAHIAQAHPNESDVISQILRDKLIYSCPICTYTSQSEMTVLRHMIDHYSGFQRCHFCGQPQTTFNGYMQHCYSDHREEIKDFCNIYTCTKISRYLQQLQLIFPNGLTVDLCNLRLTQCLKEYGDKHIKLLYDEIQKTSQQPPIPRLSLGRLVARKSIEAKMAETGGNSPMIAEAASASTAAALQLAGNNAKSLQPTIAAKRIMKRRSTVALGRDETAIEHFTMNCPPSVTTFNSKKRRMQHNLSLLPPPEVVTQSAVVDDFPSASDNEAAQPEQHELQPFSFYGQPPQQLDLNKIFIKIAAADTVETRINISKFKLLYNITPRVVVIPTDMTKYRKTAKVKRKETKPCPASHKIRYSLPAKLTN